MRIGIIDHVRVWIAPFVAFCGFILLAQVILLAPYGRPERLKAAETIALLSAAITAAGLTGIYQQFRQRNHEAALRLDELHAAFNTPEMQSNRDLGWRYLRSLFDDPATSQPLPDQGPSGIPARLNQLAEWWVCGKGTPPRAPGAPRKGESRADYDLRQVWALTAMINFYVRLENHFAYHLENTRAGDQAFLQATGPFVWRYWEADIIGFITVCDGQEFLTREGKRVPPYFVAPLKSLEQRYDRAATQSGVGA